jgi:hypothetical protein
MCTTAIKIRRADPVDKEAIQRISADAYVPAYMAILGTIPKPATEDYGPRIEKGQVWILDVEGAPTGIAVLEECAFVRTHVETGRKCFYVSTNFTLRFKDMTEEERAAVELPLSACGTARIHLSLPVAGEFDRILGQPMCPAQRHKRLPGLARSHVPGHDRARAPAYLAVAGLMPGMAGTAADVDKAPRLDCCRIGLADAALALLTGASQRRPLGIIAATRPRLLPGPRATGAIFLATWLLDR